jgi:hypothetical protein
MNEGTCAVGIEKAGRGIGAAVLATLLFGAMALATVADAARSADENRVVNHRVLDRAEIENLQRWVASGHEAWCKDPRLVAAADLRRIAANFADGAAELNQLGPAAAGGNGSRKKLAFEWTPPDGRATYRVTVERFDWLLPIAKDADGVVWVPTITEITVHD